MMLYDVLPLLFATHIDMPQFGAALPGGSGAGERAHQGAVGHRAEPVQARHPGRARACSGAAALRAGRLTRSARSALGMSR